MQARLVVVGSLTVALLATTSPVRPAPSTDPVLRIEGVADFPIAVVR